MRLRILLPSLLLAATVSYADDTEVQNSLPAATDNLFDVKLAEPTSLVVIPRGHFAWGVDVGAAVDMTSNDMTFVDIQGYFGYRSNFIRMLGVGAGINMMLSNSSRSYPVFAMFRTSFSSQPRLSFLDLRAGCAFNSIDTYKSQTDFYGSIGWGITLASSRTFTSHIILSYVYLPLSDVITETGTHHMPDLHYATIRLGASF